MELPAREHLFSQYAKTIDSLEAAKIFQHLYTMRGLLFKFVDFLYSRSDVFDIVIKFISPEICYFPYPLMYKA